MLKKIKDKNTQHITEGVFVAPRVKRRPYFLYFGIIALVIVFGAFIAPTFLSAKYFIPMEKINKSLGKVGMRAEIHGDAHFTILPHGSISLHNIEIHSNDETILVADSFNADIPFFSLIRGKMDLSNATVNGMHITVSNPEKTQHSEQTHESVNISLPSNITIKNADIKIGETTINNISAKILQKDGITIESQFIAYEEPLSLNISIPSLATCFTEACDFKADVQSKMISGEASGSFLINREHAIPFALAKFLINAHTEDLSKLSNIFNFKPNFITPSGTATLSADVSIENGVLKIIKSKLEAMDATITLEDFTLDESKNKSGVLKISGNANFIRRLSFASFLTKVPESINVITNFKSFGSGIELTSPTNIDFDSTHAQVSGTIDEKINLSIMADSLDVSKYFTPSAINDVKYSIPHTSWAPNFNMGKHMFVNVKIADLTIGILKMKDALGTISSTPASTKINIVSSKLWGGNAYGSYESKIANNAVTSGNMTFKINEANLSKVLKTGRVYGNFNASGSVSGSGSTFATMLQKLSGNIKIDGSKGGITFLNSPKLFHLGKNENPNVAVGHNKSTSIKSFGINMNISDGSAQLIKTYAHINNERLSFVGKIGLKNESVDVKITKDNARVLGTLSNLIFQSSKGVQVDVNSMIEIVKNQESKEKASNIKTAATQDSLTSKDSAPKKGPIPPKVNVDAAQQKRAKPEKVTPSSQQKTVAPTQKQESKNHNPQQVKTKKEVAKSKIVTRKRDS